MIWTDCTSYLWMLSWRWSNKTETSCHNKILIIYWCFTVILKHFVLLLECYYYYYYYHYHHHYHHHHHHHHRHHFTFCVCMLQMKVHSDYMARHGTARHGTARHDKNQRALTSTGSKQTSRKSFSSCPNDTVLSVFVIDCRCMSKQATIFIIALVYNDTHYSVPFSTL